MALYSSYNQTLAERESKRQAKIELDTNYSKAQSELQQQEQQAFEVANVEERNLRKQAIFGKRGEKKQAQNQSISIADWRKVSPKYQVKKAGQKARLDLEKQYEGQKTSLSTIVKTEFDPENFSEAQGYVIEKDSTGNVTRVYKPATYKGENYNLIDITYSEGKPVSIVKQDAFRDANDNVKVYNAEQIELANGKIIGVKKYEEQDDRAKLTYGERYDEQGRIINETQYQEGGNQVKKYDYNESQGIVNIEDEFRPNIDPNATTETSATVEQQILMGASSTATPEQKIQAAIAKSGKTGNLYTSTDAKTGEIKVYTESEAKAQQAQYEKDFAVYAKAKQEYDKAIVASPNRNLFQETVTGKQSPVLMTLTPEAESGLFKANVGMQKYQATQVAKSEPFANLMTEGSRARSSTTYKKQLEQKTMLGIDNQGIVFDKTQSNLGGLFKTGVVSQGTFRQVSGDALVAEREKNSRMKVWQSPATLIGAKNEQGQYLTGMQVGELQRARTMEWHKQAAEEGRKVAENYARRLDERKQQQMILRKQLEELSKESKSTKLSPDFFDKSATSSSMFNQGVYGTYEDYSRRYERNNEGYKVDPQNHLSPERFNKNYFSNTYLASRNVGDTLAGVANVAIETVKTPYYVGKTAYQIGAIGGEMLADIVKNPSKKGYSEAVTGGVLAGVALTQNIGTKVKTGTSNTIKELINPSSAKSAFGSLGAIFGGALAGGRIQSAGMRGAGKVYYKEFGSTKPTSFQTRAQTVAGDNYVLSLESGAMTRYKVPRASYEIQYAKINRELTKQPEFQALSKADKVREIEGIIAERQDSSAIINQNPYVSLTQYGTVKTTDNEIITLKGIDLSKNVPDDIKSTVASVKPARLSVADRPKVLMKIADEKGIASVNFYPFLSRAVKETKPMTVTKIIKTEQAQEANLFATGIQRTYVFDQKSRKVLSKSRQKVQLFKTDEGQDLLLRGTGKKQQIFEFDTKKVDDILGEIVTKQKGTGDITRSLVAQKFPRKETINFDQRQPSISGLDTEITADSNMKLYVGRTNLPATKGVAPSLGILQSGRQVLNRTGSLIAEGTLLGANQLVKVVSNIQKRPSLRSNKKGSLSTYGGFDSFMPDQPNTFVEQFTAPSTLVQETKATAPLLQVVQQPSQLIGTATKSNFESILNPRFAPANKLNVKTRSITKNNLMVGFRSSLLDQTKTKTNTGSINDAMNQSMNDARNKYLTKAQNLAINQVGIKPMDLTTPKIGSGARTRSSTLTQTEALTKPKTVAPKSPGITMPKFVVPRPVIPVEPEPLPILLLEGDSKSFKTKGLKRKKSNIDAWTQFRPSLYSIATGQKQSQKVGKYNVKSYGFEFRF
jgi:hypothetical protein